MADWKFQLAVSADLYHMAPLVNATDKNLSLQLNKPGSVSFKIPLDDPASKLVDPLSTCIIAYRNNIAVWSGYINAPLTESGDHLNVTAIGWQEILNKRIIRSDLPLAGTYTDIDDGQIVFDLVDRANSLGATPAKIFDGVNHQALTSTFIRKGTRNYSLTTQLAPRTRKFDKYTNIGQEIDTLSNMENGIDLWVHPTNRTLELYRQRLIDRTETLFGYNAPPFNISEDFEVTRDISFMVNHFRAIGRDTEGVVEDVVKQGQYALLEETGSLADVIDPQILVAYAGAEVAVRSTPRVTYRFTPFAGIQFEPFDDYDIGDLVYLSYNNKLSSTTKQPVRIFAFTVNIDNEGNEKVTNLQVNQ